MIYGRHHYQSLHSRIVRMAAGAGAGAAKTVARRAQALPQLLASSWASTGLMYFDMKLRLLSKSTSRFDGRVSVS